MKTIRKAIFKLDVLKSRSLTPSLRLHILLFISYLSFQYSIAQEQPRGVFLKESVKVGEPVKYILTYKHNTDLEIAFPDSSYNYAPFEYIDRVFFPTKSDSTGSFDSVVYTFMTFELDSIQKISVPALSIQEGEEVPIFPEEDIVFLNQLIVNLPDSISLHENTSFVEVKQKFNYPNLIASIIGFIVILTLSFFIFKPSLQKPYQLSKLRKDYKKFINHFNQLMKKELNTENIEQVLLAWKSYSGKLIEVPLYSYTTKEISALLQSQDLNQTLKNIDKAIYANAAPTEINNDLNFLKKYVSNIYQTKVEAVKNG